jgi:flagellin
MARINTNVPSLVARSNLERTGRELELRLERLSTGLRLNRGADDPAGMIIAERIRSDLRGVEQGIKNSERASSVIATTEGSLAEVNELLNTIRALVVEAANTGAFSDEELRANQLQIDSAIDSITRISNTASFGGLKLLNGSLDYTLSGVAASAISRANVHAASFIGEEAVEVEVNVVASAQTGALYIRGDLREEADYGTLLSSTTLRVAGSRGVVELSFPSGATYAQVVKAVNNLTQQTGVKADLVNGNANSGMVFKSEAYGASAFVSVERVDKPKDPTADSFQTYSIANNGPVPGSVPFPWSEIGTTLIRDSRDEGRDVTALINGRLATGDGLNVSTNSPSLGMELLLNEEFATDPTLENQVFHITGGGALFQLGPEVTAQQQVNVGVQSVAASLLGGTLADGSLQFLSSLKTGESNSLKASRDRNNFTTASDILQQAIDETSILRGRLGAFEANVLQTNVRSLQTATENLNASTSRIRDADFAYETSMLTRAQILASSGTTILTLANQQAQQALQLLG